MVPLPIILYGVFLTTITTAIRKCDDCVKITDCAPALLLSRSPATRQQFQNAVCGFEDVQKVCCSDFSSSPILIEENNNESNTQIFEDEIDYHHHINLLPSECGQINEDRIVGGSSASLYEFPWLALISYRHEESVKFRCVGTVISARYVLTAAHCIANHKIAGVRIGAYDISQPEDCKGDNELRKCESKYQDIAISSTIRHPGFETRPFIVNDIGLLRLARPIDFSYRNAGAICLPIKKHLRERNLVGEIGVAAGWNFFSGVNKTNVVQKDRLPILSTTECNSLYNSISRTGEVDSTRNVICVRDSDKVNAGAPLMLEGIHHSSYNYVQYGIFSYGPRLIGSEKPVVYTDVRNYLKWIMDTI